MAQQKTVYLISAANVGEDGRRLSLLGRMEAYLLGCYFKKMKLHISAIYHDCEEDVAETADIISSVSGIHAQPAPAGSGTARLKVMADKEDSNLVLVSTVQHNIDCLSEIAETPSARSKILSQPRAALNQLSFRENQLHVLQFGENVRINLDDRDCEGLMAVAGTPDDIIQNGFAAAELAEKIAYQLRNTEAILDLREIRTAALMRNFTEHIDRERHAEMGADLLDSLGYRPIAESIRFHHRLPEDRVYIISSELIVFYADKLISGKEPVSYECYRNSRIPQAADPKIRMELLQTEFVKELLDAMALNVQ